MESRASLPIDETALLLVPCCGMGNRLQAIICGQLLAEDTGRRFFVNWESEGHDCATHFTNLFLPVFDRMEVIPDDVVCYSSIQKHMGCATERYLPLLKKEVKESFFSVRSDHAVNVAVFSCHLFLQYFHDQRFNSRLRELINNVRPEIKSKVDRYQDENFSVNTMGVHIRRKDWKSQKNMSYYFNHMDKFSTKNSDVSFYVCSDDESSLTEIRERYSNVHVYPARSLTRGSSEAIEDALIELLLLSRTKVLIGTPGSTFSAMAQCIGGMPANFKHGFSWSRRDVLHGNISFKILFRRFYHRAVLALQGY